MKRPTVARLKRVTAENLVGLGAERLAEILVVAAGTRPELKRRLRMELAAVQGADHLAAEIDRRLASLETSRSKVSWRQRPTFVKDLDVLRALIAERLAELDAAAALDRMWLFMDAVAKRVGSRVRDRDGALAAVFERAAGDVGDLLAQAPAPTGVAGLVDAMVKNPSAWADWLEPVLARTSPDLADAALRLMSARAGATPTWLPLLRRLADAARDIDAFRATFSKEALRRPQVAAEVAQRLLAAGRIDEAGQVLGGAKAEGADFAWESAWIDYLDAAGRKDEAQAARWASFERTLSAERARSFTQRLADFDDVEAEQRAFQHAAGHVDFACGLRFLMDWPALPEAARMIQARSDEAEVPGDLAELWAGKLRQRQPLAAETLLRKAAAAAFRCRDYAASDRLTHEADAIGG